jgi:hypothetical protein
MSNAPKGSARAARPAASSAPPATTFRARHPMLTALIPVALVLAVVATMIVIKVSGGPASALSAQPTRSAAGSSTTTNGATALPAGVLADVSSVSPTTLAAVGRPDGLALPTKATGHAAVLTGTGGKPEVLYVGAEYCPYCAAERWALVQALSRFGTFSHLSATHSSTTDSYPDTQTFSFYGSTYTSAYLDFVSVEEYTNQPAGGSYTTLQTPTGAETEVMDAEDAGGSIPFLDIGNREIFIGASYNPMILHGLSLSAIAAQLEHPASTVAQAIDGTANEITASICGLTKDQPAAVCATPTISAIARSLGS